MMNLNRSFRRSNCGS